MTPNNIIKIFLSTIFLVICFSACKKESNKNPEWITKKDAIVTNGDVYILSYDKNSIKEDSKIVSLWIRSDWANDIVPILTKQGKVKKDMLQEEFDSAIANYIKNGTYLGTTLKFIEVNCDKNLIRTISKTEYRNNIPEAEEIINERFTVAPPKSVGQDIIGWACN